MKTLVVASEIQKHLLEKILLHEIVDGFWKNAKPINHGLVWKDVNVVIGENLGPKGFSITRNYNFVNPTFFEKYKQSLLECSRQVNNDITLRHLKKQLIFLNQIIGVRIKEIGGELKKLKRGRKVNKNEIITIEKKNANVVVKKALATIII